MRERERGEREGEGESESDDAPSRCFKERHVTAKEAMCRWTLGTVERRCGVLLDPNSGVVDQIRGRGFYLSRDPSAIATFLSSLKCTSKPDFMRYAGSLDVRCVRT